MFWLKTQFVQFGLHIWIQLKFAIYINPNIVVLFCFVFPKINIAHRNATWVHSAWNHWFHLNFNNEVAHGYFQGMVFQSWAALLSWHNKALLHWFPWTSDKSCSSVRFWGKYTQCRGNRNWRKNKNSQAAQQIEMPWGFDWSNSSQKYFNSAL